MREGQSRRPIGSAAKRKTPITRADKTDKTPEADQLGIVAIWSVAFGYVSVQNPTTGEWHDLKPTDAPGWSVGEARRRKELYRNGNRRAYRLTSRDMEEIWNSEQSLEEGIVEDHHVEEEG